MVLGVRRLEVVHDPKAMQLVVEGQTAALGDLVQRLLALVAKGGVAQIVPDGDGAHQVHVQVQSLGNGRGHGGDMKLVLQPRAEMIVARTDEDLRLMPAPPESPAMDDARVVSLELGAILALVQRMDAAGTPLVGRECSFPRKSLSLCLFGFLSRGRNV